MFEKRNSAPQKGTPVAVHGTRPEQPAPEPRPKLPANASIGPGLAVSGDVAGKADLNIEGKLEGTVDLPENVVTVAQPGDVKANITAGIVNISGRVVGDIVGIEQVILTKTAMMRGNIKAPRVNLENGSKFKGSIDMDPIDDGVEKTATRLANKPAKGEPVKTAPPPSHPRESAVRH